MEKALECKLAYLQGQKDAYTEVIIKLLEIVVEKGIEE